jgi:hypothetical protein
MDYIKGKLKILGDLEYFNRDGAYYSPRGINLTGAEIVADIDTALIELSEFKVYLTLESTFELTFNTNLYARGLYETVIYPATYGPLEHIFCVGPLETIDLKDNWEQKVVMINNKAYYAYTQKNRVKDNNLTYRFVVNR